MSSKELNRFRQQARKARDLARRADRNKKRELVYRFTVEEKIDR